MLSDLEDPAYELSLYLTYLITPYLKVISILTLPFYARIEIP